MQQWKWAESALFEWQRLNSFTLSSQLDKVHKGSATVAFPGIKVRVNSKQSKDRRTRAQKKKEKQMSDCFICFSVEGSSTQLELETGIIVAGRQRQDAWASVSTVMFLYYHNVFIIMDSFKHKKYPWKLVSNFCVWNKFYIGIQICQSKLAPYFGMFCFEIRFFFAKYSVRGFTR